MKSVLVRTCWHINILGLSRTLLPGHQYIVKMAFFYSHLILLILFLESSCQTNKLRAAWINFDFYIQTLLAFGLHTAFCFLVLTIACIIIRFSALRF